MTRKVILTSSLYETSRRLFIAYPLAADEGDNDRTTRSMVLQLRDADEADYFVLSQHCGEGRFGYSIRRWPAGAVATVDADGDELVPGMLARAVRLGIPLPRDGSLFGWKQDGIITALIAVYTEWSPEVPEPCWSVMPRAGAPRVQWPPFTDDVLIGDWFWEFVQDGKVVSLEDLIAETAETVFWADTAATVGSGCCVVTRDLSSTEGYALPSGCYVYHEVLQTGARIPSVQELLVSVGKTDLAARFY